MKPVRYFDYNSTHPPFGDILETNTREYIENYFNPSGVTRFSLKRQGKIEEARKFFSAKTKKPESGFLFCSTGTEANYFLLASLKNKKSGKFIVSGYEHPSFYNAAKDLQLPMILLPSDKSGRLDPESVEKVLEENPDSVLCALHVSNETGVIQDMEELSKIAIKYDSILVSDLMQSFGKLKIPYSALSGFTFSAHKIGGGTGAACVFVEPELLDQDFHLFGGGNQENGHRAGTENVPAIVSFWQAYEKQSEIRQGMKKGLEEFQIELEDLLRSLGAEIVSQESPRIHTTTTAILPIDDIDFFLMGLEEKGIIISNGSSCKSRSREASAVLLRMGYSEEEALRAVRISPGIFTTRDDMDFLLSSFREVLEKLLITQ